MSTPAKERNRMEFMCMMLAVLHTLLTIANCVSNTLKKEDKNYTEQINLVNDFVSRYYNNDLT